MFINYNRCLTNLTNSILKHFSFDTYHETLEELDKILENNNSKNIVVILYDGMGAKVIDKVLGQNNFFNNNKLCEIDSVFPATTAAATTTVMSGLNPCEHGWIGWNVYLKEIDKTVTLLTNEEKETKKQIEGYHAGYKLMPYESIVEKINNNNGKAFYISPYGDYKYKTLEEMNDLIRNICSKEGKKYLYVYNDEPDYSLHEFGFNSDIIKELMLKIEKSTKDLCDSLEDSTVIIIADHGHTNTVPVYIKKYKDFYDTLKRTTSIDSRCATFFVKEDKLDTFKEEFNKNFTNDFIMMTKKEVLENKLFGTGTYNKHFEDALGDYLAIAKTDKYFHDDNKNFIYKSHHAGIKEEELKVPVIVIKK